MLTLVLCAALFAFGALVVVHPRRADMLALLVGASAGLDFAQVHNVHLFNVAVAAWFIGGQQGVWRAFDGRALLLLVGAVALAATSLVGDLVVSPTLALQLLALTAGGWLIATRATPRDLELMAKGLLAIVTLSALIGLAQAAGIAPLRPTESPDLAGRPMGFYREPDWLGFFSAVGMILTLRGRYSRAAKVILLLLFGTAMVLAAARAQLLGLGVVGAVAWLSRLANPATATERRTNRRALLVFATVGVAALLAFPSVSASVRERLEGAVSARRDVSAQARVQQITSLRLLASTAPWYGHGLSSAGRVGVSGNISYGNADNSVGSNWLLSWWADGKLLALPIIFGLLLCCVTGARSLGGWILIAALCTSLFSNVTMTPIVWFAAGIALAAAPWRPRSGGPWLRRATAQASA